MSRKRFVDKNRKRVRKGPGVYSLFAKGAKKPTYIGSAKNLNRRLSEHQGQKYHTFEVKHTNSTKEARGLERKLIKRKRPRRNKVYA
jgi:excinuclease UvrABC nuclease subunit